MKRPTEFWAAVALAGVIVYMVHDAWGSRSHPLEVIEIEQIELPTEWKSSITPHRDFEPAGVYYENAS